MKRILLPVFAALFLFSCKKDDTLPRVETITSGNKWGLKIGSSYVDVYHRLQTLGMEKNFSQVGLVYQQPFSKPEEIQNRLEFYSAITLETKTGVLERVIIVIGMDQVTSLQAGGALPDEILKWPKDVSDEIAIKKDDPISEVYAKLDAIYQIPAYNNNFRIVLPDKPLNKPFDPGMMKYEEWAFVFSMKVGPSKNGRSSVRLYFKDGKLSKIRHEYNEFDVYN